MPAEEEAAQYECDFKPYEDFFICTCYWINSRVRESVSIKEDKSKNSRTFGLSLSFHQNNRVKDSTYHYEDGTIWKSYQFYDNGQLADSTFYNEKNVIDSGFNYFKDGKLRAIYHYDTLTKQENLEAFDELGNELKNIKYKVKASFPDGENGWRRFLQRNLNASVPVEHNAPSGIYKVVVRFIVQKDGTLRDIRAETKMGYGMEKEVIKLLLKSPKWEPAILLGNAVEAQHRQPVTFIVDSN